ncbi:tail fiber domain-containing protein [uncultured Arcticibacterium sp.]|uniref:tail fiber domain-containing protein n=1 Tax=uncultured Arcticibacterium sp. TaxID=2173042 RepID=UPI0030F5F297
MNKILPVIVLVLVPFFIKAQSVLISPGAQSINGDSTNQDQLNVFGKGLLVGPKVEFTEDDPASNVHTMSCATGVPDVSLAGTLKDPGGDLNYFGGFAYDCEFDFKTDNIFFLAYQLDFESFGTEAEGDTLFVLNYYTSEIIEAYSGSTLPERLVISDKTVKIKFKTDSDHNTGSGFVLKWKAILQDEVATDIQNYFGEGLVYDAMSRSLWSGRHNPWVFDKKGLYSTALGLDNEATGNYSTALGARSISSADNSTAIGYNSISTGAYSLAMGTHATVSGNSSIGIGNFSEAQGDYSVVLGTSNLAAGDYSTAIGYKTKAVSYNSTALGYNTVALGNTSTAMGYESMANGDYSIAIGYSTEASGGLSTAMGSDTDASGDYSTAMGNQTKALGSNSTSMGLFTEASGNSSTAIGYRTKASGDYSTASGTRATTNGFRGAMVISDYVVSTGDSLKADASNRFLARFHNGYKLYTNNDLSASSIGLMALNNANSWSSISDSTKKENFIASNGEDVLKSVAAMRIGTWNYKGQNVNKHRHWGVMAQDFHHHFGNDAYGTIGNDSTIATADFDGVSFAAIKALEARTRELQEELATEKRFSASLKAVTDDLRKDIGAYASRIEKLEAKLEEHTSLKSDFKELKEMLLKSVAVKED